MRLYFIFLDGIGLGEESLSNPFVQSETPGLSTLLEGNNLAAGTSGFVGEKVTLVGLDACLGVSGYPQSATGQATIFTGMNAPVFLGEHLNGFPNQKLRKLLAQRGLFQQFKKIGLQVAFANAYRPIFFNSLRLGLPGNRYSCSTLITYYGGLPFFSLQDVKSERALFMDITNETLRNINYDVPLFSPEKGAENLIRIGRNFDFILFEYFLSDLAGHLADSVESDRVISILDRFINALSSHLNPAEEMVIISSDHGNLEELSTQKHTHNKVPALLIGNKELRSLIAGSMKDLTDLLPAFFEVLNW